MEENIYRFDVDADVSTATENLNKIVKLMDTIDELNKKGKDNYFYSSQKDIDTNVKSMKEVIKLSKDLERQLNNIKSVQASRGDFGGINVLNTQLKAVQDNVQKTRSMFEQLGDNRQKMSGLDRDTIKEQQRYNTDLGEQIKHLKEIKRLNTELTQTERRVHSRASNYSSAGRATFNQANIMRGDMDTLRSASGMREDNEARIRALNDQINVVDQEMASLAKNTAKNDQERINETASLKESRSNLEQMIRAIQESNSIIDSFGETLDQVANKMKNVDVTPDPRTMRGQLDSRSNSIGIALTGAFLGAFGGLYSKGGTANRAMRQPTINIGQSTGNSDFRGIRKQLQQMGLEEGLNYKGMDMIQFQETVMGAMGYKDQESLSSTTRALAEGSRAMPVDNENLKAIMENLMRNGAVSSAEQVKAIQEGFLGAIQQSGMIGREKEQLDALNTISSQVFTGRNGDQTELNNLLALQSMLSGSGAKSLQGSSGAELLTNLDAGLKGAVSNNTAKLLFGKGVNYQGADGLFQLEEQLEKGISDPDNLRRMFEISSTFAGEGASAEKQMGIFKTQARNVFGTTITADQTRALYDATNGGQNLTDEALARASEALASEGAKKYDENLNNYAGSNEATADRSEAVTEYQASKMNDYGDYFREINSKLGGMHTTLYAILGAVGASAVASLSSIGMGGISGGIKKLTKTKFAGGGGIGAWAKSLFTGGGATAVAGEGIKGTMASVGGKALGGLGKAGGFLQKAMPWLGLATTAVDVATSDDKVKALGRGGGTMSGAWMGGKLGAGIGTAIAPGIGTAIGGGLGSLAGAFIGSSAGEKVIDLGRGIKDWTKDRWSGVKSFFGGETAEASEIQTSGMSAGNQATENKAGRQEEKDTTNKKLQSEKAREKNVMDEGANLTTYATLLDRAQKLLTDARAQGGIFGKGGTGQASGTGGLGSLSTIGDGSKWTNKDITKHDLGKTVMGMTAESLDAWIDSVAPKGSAMRGMGADFLEAGRQSGLDPRYLVAHSALETGWGSSALSGGGNKQSGNWFGIGAFDNNPNNGFNYGDGLVGGAKWIAENYYKSGQTTLDSMVNNGGVHEYATDPEWAQKIASIMKGSEGFTKGTAQNFNTTNNVNVTLGGESGASGANGIGALVGRTVRQSLDDSIDFFAKELKRA